MQGNRTAFHRMAIDKGRAAKVPEIVTIAFRVNPGMVVAEMRIIDANIVLWSTPDNNRKFVQRKTPAGVRTMPDVQGGPPYCR